MKSGYSEFFNNMYYRFKPIIPRRLRMVFRRYHARWVRARYSSVWPIDQGTARIPAGWLGWPEGKKFAFVITHDVESEVGLKNVRNLAELEMALGFRSAFNFIPEGSYAVPGEIRDWLTKNGFEVGVHDLHHDGKLFRSRGGFLKCAESINSYLREWNAVGYRSGFMLRNMEWFRDLNITYDTSTFDTDPFEPQPEGIGTIFPFWVPPDNERKGYIELPYTLTQDSTLFLTLEQETNDVWKKKMEWLASQGGMALMNVHPDYLKFSSRGSGKGPQFPAEWYREFLEYIRERYRNEFWHALPKGVAEYAYERRDILNAPEKVLKDLKGVGKPRKIWIDLDNTPHIPFFIPIMKELESRGYRVVLTARDAFQVCELANLHRLAYAKVGKHYGKHIIIKLFGLLWRSLQLLPFIWRERPDIAISHGARSQIFISNVLRIPSVLILDYEHSKTAPLCYAKWEILPEALPKDGLHADKQHVLHYPGIKEDVYAPSFVPDATIYESLGLVADDFLVTVRPPASEAHYRSPESDLLFEELMNMLTVVPEIRIVLLPRNASQEDYIRLRWPRWFADRKTIVPTQALNGLNLLWHSDFVVSGGGTMNREAAALGVPVYSIFRGPTGAVDRQLEREGRLVMVNSVKEVKEKIVLRRRVKGSARREGAHATLDSIVAHIESILSEEYST